MRTQPQIFARRFAKFALLAGAFSTTMALAAVTFDGQLDFTDGQEWGSPENEAVQDNHTGFGDQIPTSWSGSELDELYLRTDGEYLYVAVTGNLEFNGNSQIILLDVKPGVGLNSLKTEITPELDALGQVVACAGIGPPYAVPNLGQALIGFDNGTPADPGDDTTIKDPASTPTKLDAGFAPDYAIHADTFGGVLYITQYNFAESEIVPLGQWDDPITNNGDVPCANRIEALDYFATRVARGSNLVGNTLGTVDNGINPNSSLFGYDNSAFLGVTGSAVAAPGSGLPGDPRMQTKGFESKISLLDLGFAPEDLPLAGPLNVKALVLLTSGGGLVSSQTLPGIGGGGSPANLNMRPDFTTILGDQFVDSTLTPAPFTPAPVIDGSNILSEWGVSSIVASQNTVTGFGDHGQNPDIQSSGSELDQMFLQDGPAGSNTIEIGIPGNLEGNGNNLVIFLDTQAGGEATLADNVGRLAGNNGDTLPMEADYAVLLNIYQGGIYVDLHDLAANTESFIGFNGVGTGEGILEKDALPVADWRLSLNNDNSIGVSATAADDPQVQLGKAVTATTGFEIAVPLSAIGSPPAGTDLCILAIVTGNGGDRYLSNQILPAGLGGGKANWGTGDPAGTRTNLDTQGYTCLSMVVQEVPPTCNNPRFDTDNDGDVDQKDFGVVQACFTGPGPGNDPYPSGCECYDWNTQQSDGDIDQEDIGIFEICARGSIPLGISGSGPTVPADPTCDDPVSP